MTSTAGPSTMRKTLRAGMRTIRNFKHHYGINNDDFNDEKGHEDYKNTDKTSKTTMLTIMTFSTTKHLTKTTKNVREKSNITTKFRMTKKSWCWWPHRPQILLHWLKQGSSGMIVLKHRPWPTRRPHNRNDINKNSNCVHEQLTDSYSTKKEAKCTVW